MSKPNQFDIAYEKKKLAWETSIKRLDFEIGLLWQRGLYFMTFIAVIATGYFQLKDVDDFERSLLASLGFLVSLAWCLANIGSKYWQAVWEFKVKKYERDITGTLYGLTPKKGTEPFLDEDAKEANEMFVAFHNKRDWLKGRRFSVSKIAIFVSALVSFFWFLLSVQHFTGWKIGEFSESFGIVPIVVLVFAFLLLSLTYSDD
jgi:hypothetical protein